MRRVPWSGSPSRRNRAEPPSAPLAARCPAEFIVTGDRQFESGSLQQRVCELSVPERRTDRRERPVKLGGRAFDVLLAPIGARGAVIQVLLCPPDRPERQARSQERAFKRAADDLLGLPFHR
jgi:hypothetical protein